MAGTGQAGLGRGTPLEHVLVDSCVLLDVITADAQWQSWSSDTDTEVPAGRASGHQPPDLWGGGLCL